MTTLVKRSRSVVNRRRTGSQKLINEIQLARVRLARAESKWELADEQARAARRRRKEAKQAARRARKQARQAKREFAEAKEALIATEERFATIVERTARARKLARARRAAKAAVARTRAKLSQPAGVRATPKRAILAIQRASAASRVRAAAAKTPPRAKAKRTAARRRKTAVRKPSPMQTKKAAKVVVPLGAVEKAIVVPRDFEAPPLGPDELSLPGRPPLDSEPRDLPQV